MEKLDFRKSDKALYAGKIGVFTLIDVPDLPYLTIDGIGDPDLSPDFKTATSALYNLAYGVKFLAKKVLQRDHGIGMLEGLWWADDMADFVKARRATWRWKLMVRQPDWISADMVEETRAAKLKVLTGKKDPLTTPDMVSAVRLENLTEGTCLQVLHIGPYTDEAPLIARLHDIEIPARGLRAQGHHHEIYLNDPRMVAPHSLKTLLRQPVIPA